MRSAALLLASLLVGAGVSAATAYVTDELVLGVYAEQNGQGQRLTTLHSGASVDTLAVNGEFTQVRLNDGTTGWVKSTYLTTREPATTRVKELEEELDRNRATTPALAEAAARSELEGLRRELAAKQTEVDALRGPDASAGSASVAASGMAMPGSTPPAVAPESDSVAAVSALRAHASAAVAGTVSASLAAGAALAALAVGFWLGYATLARRVKHKFGGIKIY